MTIGPLVGILFKVLRIVNSQHVLMKKRMTDMCKYDLLSMLSYIAYYNLDAISIIVDVFIYRLWLYIFNVFF